MSHTNSTTNYNLPQFIGTDKPTWLNDVNGAMSAIDAQMKANADSATSASTSATTANTNIGTLANLNTTAKTDLVSAVNEVNTATGTAQQTANTAIANANTAKTEAETLANKFNINQFIQYTKDTSGVTCVNGTIGGGEIYIARNNEGSLFKIYGRMSVTLTGSDLSTIKITLPNTGIRTNTNYNIVDSGIAYDNGNLPLGLAPTTITIKDNSIDIEFVGRVNGHIQTLQLFPCLLIGGDFGDITPSE